MNSSKSRYLIYADDDEDDILLFETYFSHIGNIRILSFFNGQEVLDYLTPLEPDQFPSFIILDINMPVLSGWETVARLKADNRYRRIPLVMFTTSLPELERERVKQYQVEVVTKPFKRQDARGIAEKLLSYCTVD
jgi:CheY-like chemotaxis protein